MHYSGCRAQSRQAAVAWQGISGGTGVVVVVDVVVVGWVVASSKSLGNPRFPLQGSFKRGIDVGVDIGLL